MYGHIKIDLVLLLLENLATLGNHVRVKDVRA